MHSQLTRRHFGLLGMAAVPFSLGAAARRGSGMKFGFTTYTWGNDWDIPTLIANCTRAKAYGVELRTSMKAPHKIELELSDSGRAEAKKRFADSPVKVVGLASSEKFDHLDPAKLKAAVEAAKGYMKLSHDVGGSGVRVFCNDFHKEVPQEQTIAQIARSLNEVAKYAAGYNQTVRLENHGSMGRFATLRKVMDQVTEKNVRLKLNCEPQDDEGGKFAENFLLVKNFLDDTLHMHDIKNNDKKFPYELQAKLLADMHWSGWWLVEMSTKVPDKVAALIEQREAWEAVMAKAVKRA